MNPGWHFIEHEARFVERGSHFAEHEALFAEHEAHFVERGSHFVDHEVHVVERGSHFADPEVHFAARETHDAAQLQPVDNAHEFAATQLWKRSADNVGMQVINNLSFTTRLQTVTNALKKHYRNAPLHLRGTTYRAREVIKIFEAQLVALVEVESAKKRWQQAVANRRASLPQVLKLFEGLEAFVRSTQSETSQVFADFGFAPRRKGKRTVEAKASAAVKLRATRRARHTMGRKQRMSTRTSANGSANGSAANGAANGAAK